MQDLYVAEQLKEKIVSYGRAEVDDRWQEFVSLFHYSRPYLVEKGHAELFLRNRTIRLEEGRLYFIPSTVIGAHCEGRMTHDFLHFMPEGELSDRLMLCPPPESIPATPLHTALFAELIDIPQHNDSAAADLKRRAVLFYLLSGFVSDLPPDSANRRFLPILRYIDEHLNERLTNRILGDRLYLNEVYFSNLFKKTFGQPPVTYINARRISVAASMLLETELPVKQIAWHLGFENETYFNRIFKKQTGVSPGHFRAKKGMLS